jgi:hypothetical protein
MQDFFKGDFYMSPAGAAGSRRRFHRVNIDSRGTPSHRGDRFVKCCKDPLHTDRLRDVVSIHV